MRWLAVLAVLVAGPSRATDSSCNCLALLRCDWFDRNGCCASKLLETIPEIEQSLSTRGRWDVDRHAVASVTLCRALTALAERRASGHTLHAEDAIAASREASDAMLAGPAAEWDHETQRVATNTIGTATLVWAAMATKADELEPKHHNPAARKPQEPQEAPLDADEGRLVYECRHTARAIAFGNPRMPLPEVVRRCDDTLRAYRAARADPKLRAQFCAVCRNILSPACTTFDLVAAAHLKCGIPPPSPIQ